MTLVRGNSAQRVYCHTLGHNRILLLSTHFLNCVPDTHPLSNTYTSDSLAMIPYFFFLYILVEQKKAFIFQFLFCSFFCSVMFVLSFFFFACSLSLLALIFLPEFVSLFLLRLFLLLLFSSFFLFSLLCFAVLCLVLFIQPLFKFSFCILHSHDAAC